LFVPELFRLIVKFLYLTYINIFDARVKLQIFICIQIRILHIWTSEHPHYTPGLSMTGLC